MGLFGPDITKLKNSRDWEGLRKVLDHKKPQLRKEAAEALRELAGPDALAALLKAIQDPEPDVRVYAVQGLSRVKGPESEAALRKASTDENWEVKKEALVALVKSTRDPAVLLEAVKFNSTELREMAAFRLGDVGGPDAVGSLIQALSDPEEMVRLRAANALGKLKDVSSLDALIDALKDKDPQVAKAARQALEWTQGEDVDPLLKNRVREQGIGKK